MNTRNGDQLLPLKQRLTKTQQFKRREKIMAKGVRMEQLEGSLGSTQNLMVNAFNALAKMNKRRARVGYVLHAASLSATAYALAKLLGYL